MSPPLSWSPSSQTNATVPPLLVVSAILAALALPLHLSAQTPEGYYADLFMDGGVSLTSRTTLPAADLLGLSMEYLATEDQAIQDSLIVGNANDDNGVLLYPDGEPRFRCVYVNGGGATAHGSSLGSVGRQRFIDHHAGGGSYTGSCAGAFLCTEGYDNKDIEQYLHIWPARSVVTGLLATSTGHFVPPTSPLLQYSDFGGDLYIDNVYHNGGPYYIEGDADHWAPGTEVLLTYDYPARSMHGNVSCWAHRPSLTTGRTVVIGSHPEGVTSGERLDLMAAILQYALAGTAAPDIKGPLENGITRLMSDNATVGHERIGDRQYHHFTMEIPEDTERLTVTLDGDDAYDLDLFVRLGDVALRLEDGVITAENSAAADETIILDNPAAGTWHIGVKCYTRVTTTARTWGAEYTGNLGVLNGVSYSLTAEWESAQSPSGVVVY